MLLELSVQDGDGWNGRVDALGDDVLVNELPHLLSHLFAYEDLIVPVAVAGAELYESQALGVLRIGKGLGARKNEVQGCKEKPQLHQEVRPDALVFQEVHGLLLTGLGADVDAYVLEDRQHPFVAISELGDLVFEALKSPLDVLFRVGREGFPEVAGDAVVVDDKTGRLLGPHRLAGAVHPSLVGPGVPGRWVVVRTGDDRGEVELADGIDVPMCPTEDLGLLRMFL